MSTESQESANQAGPLKIILFSFGFKHGRPEADMMWDVRFLPNPYWDEVLKPFTGLDERVARYVLDNSGGMEFMKLFEPMIIFLAKSFIGSSRSEVRFAIGCTGGKHRSVAVTEQLARVLAEAGLRPEVFHRDIDKE